MTRGRRIHLCSTVCAALGVLVCPASLLALDPEKRITQFVHTSWTAREGAPNDLRYIAQTPDGYLWLGSPLSTFRFDGTRFLPWNPPPAWAHLTERGSRGALFVSRDGSLWMGLANGLARIGNDAFAWHEVGALTNGITSIVEEDDDHLLLEDYRGGVYRFDRGTGRSNRLSERDGLAGGLPVMVWQDRAGTIWVGEEGVWKGAASYRDSERGRYATENAIVYKPRGERMFRQTGVKVGDVGGFAEGADGTIWLVETVRSVRVLRTPDGRWLPPGPEIAKGSLGAIVDRHGSLWITTLGDGLVRVADPHALLQSTTPRAAPARHIQAYTEQHGLSGDMLYVAFEDREGNLWVGGTNGLDRFRDVRLAELTAQEGIRLNVHVDYTTIVPDAGGVAVASVTLNGLLQRIDRAGTLSSQFVYMDRRDRFGGGCAAAGRNPVLSLYRAPDGVLWAAGRLLYRRDRNGWHCVPLKSGTERLLVNTLTTDGGNGFWLGTRTGLWRYAADGTLTRVEAARSRNVSTLLAQPDGTLWFGGIDGLSRLQDGRIVDIVTAADLPRGGVYTIFDAGRGDIGVLERGGLQIVRDGRVVKPPGLAATPIAGCWFVVRADADLWFNCAHGLLRIPGAEWDALAANLAHTPAYELFDAAADLRSTPVRGGSAGSIARSDDGRIWFVTAKGVGYIDPARLDRTRHPPPVYIERARSGDRTIDVKAQAARLEPLSQPLEVSVTGISLGQPERLRFRFRLEGLDPDWRETHQGTVSYSNLSAGEYRLRVLAIDHQGTPSDQEAVWRFSVAPRWHQRWSVRLVAMALTGLFIWGIVRMATARQAIRLKREFGVQLAERTRIAQDLHDTLLQSACAALMHVELAGDALTSDMPSTTSSRDRALPALKRATQILSGMNAEGRAAVQGLRERSTAGDLAEALRRVGHEHPNGNDVAFQVTVVGSVRALQPPVGEEVYRIAREALVNAYQHANPRRIEVDLVYTRRSFRCVIRDDGCGIEERIVQGGREGHWGLAGMRERAARVGAELRVRSIAGGGTEVELYVKGRLAFGDPRPMDRVRQWLNRHRLRPQKE